MQPATTDTAASGNVPMRTRANIGGLAAGVREEQAAPYYQALAMEKLGQQDRAKAIFNQLVDAGNKALGGAPAANPPGQSSRPRRNARRSRTRIIWLVWDNSG